MRADQLSHPRYRAATVAAALARHYPDASPQMVARIVFEMQSAGLAAKHSLEAYGTVGITLEQDEFMQSRLTRLSDAINADLTYPGLLKELVPGAPTHPDPARFVLGDSSPGAYGHLHITGHRGDGFDEGYIVY